LMRERVRLVLKCNDANAHLSVGPVVFLKIRHVFQLRRAAQSKCGSAIL
jgi:hypothetical protein